MHKWTAAIASCAAAAVFLAAPALEAKAPRPNGEMQLAKILEGREAGEPQSCIPSHATSRVRIIRGTAIIYDSGRTIYVNRPANPRTLSNNDILVVDRLGHELCKTDMVHTRSQGSPGFRTGSVFLGEFVPYTKVAAE